MTLVQDGLFPPPPTPRPRKADKPAYRMSRQYAQVAYETDLALFRAHHFGTDGQPGCVQCHQARETAEAKGVPATFEMCLTGRLLFRSYSSIARGLRSGYYPDRDRPKPDLGDGPAAESLFDPEGTRT